MSFSVVIPARYAAKRLPGKPLLDICGKSMLQHTYERSIESKADRVIIATADSRGGAGIRCIGLHDIKLSCIRNRSNSRSERSVADG